MWARGAKDDAEPVTLCTFANRHGWESGDLFGIQIFVWMAGMQEIWSQTLARLKAAPDAALEWGKSGVDFLRSSIGSLPFLAATSADSAVGNPERDETHYFLVPNPVEAGGFTLAERRRLPVGVGTVNSLPKVRVFHVHDPAALAILEERLAGKITAGRPHESGIEGDVAARLEAMGEEIDRQSHWVTGGLIVVGGAVAIANPLLGIGIAANALFPKLGGTFAKFGLGAAADMVKKAGTAWRESSAKKDAAAEVKRMKAELSIDPVLVFLNRLVSGDGGIDPHFAELDALPEWWRDRDQRMTMEVASGIWREGPWRRWAEDIRARLMAMDVRG